MPIIIEKINYVDRLASNMQSMADAIKTINDDEISGNNVEHIKIKLRQCGYEAKTDDLLNDKIEEIILETQKTQENMIKEMIYTATELLKNDFTIIRIAPPKYHPLLLINDEGKIIDLGENNAHTASKLFMPTIRIDAAHGKSYETTTIRISDDKSDMTIGSNAPDWIDPYDPKDKSIHIVIGDKTTYREKFTALLDSLEKESANESLGR